MMQGCDAVVWCEDCTMDARDEEDRGHTGVTRMVQGADEVGPGHPAAVGAYLWQPAGGAPRVVIEAGDGAYGVLAPLPPARARELAGILLDLAASAAVVERVRA